jgi:flagellar motor switch protein FliM
MSMKDLLSQDEIDALLHGVSTDEIETEDHSIMDDGEAEEYDFSTQERAIRGRMPSLDMVNERFARGFRNSLFKMLRRGTEVTISSVQMLKYPEYVYSLVVPTSLSVVKMHPLRGSCLLVMDPKLVFMVVDNYFGGNGKFQAVIEGRDFAPTELRLIQKMMDFVFVDLQRAWKPVMDVELEFINSEVNPQFANIVSQNDVVVVTTFLVEVEGVGGEFHIALPYSLLEPIQDRLETVQHAESNASDLRWSNALKDELEHASVNLSCVLTKKKISLKQVLDLKAGDVIPVDLSGPATMYAEGIPALMGHLHNSKGHNAVKITKSMGFPSRELRDISEEVIDE